MPAKLEGDAKMMSGQAKRKKSSNSTMHRDANTDRNKSSDQERNNLQAQRPAQDSTIPEQEGLGKKQDVTAPVSAPKKRRRSVSPAGLDLEIQARLGHTLRVIYQELVNEPIPDRFLRLLDELEEGER
jgi:Anti-sigma factor NepR